MGRHLSLFCFVLENPMDILITERLQLRPVSMTDAPQIVALSNNWNVSRMLSLVPYPNTLADCEPWISKTIDRNAAGLDLVYAIEHHSVIGVTSLVNLDSIPRLGYWLAEPAWGQGFATEACAAMIHHAFKFCTFDKIESYVFSDNTTSLRVQKKLGFEVTGTERKFCLARNTELDTIQTALSRTVFEKTRSTQPQA
jgi:RimJ/RimL family protein N-acetyltransferase